MSAETLRRAARAMRHDTFNGQTEDAPFLDAIADWLDKEVDRSEVVGVVEPRAIVVARAYLGEEQ